MPPRRRLITGAAAFLALASMKARGQLTPGGGGGGGGGRATYTGVLATRNRLCTNTAVATLNFTERSYLFARANITTAQVATQGWYVTGNVGEQSVAAAMTVTGSIEFPPNTFTQLKWSGATSVTVQPGTTVLSDAATVTIPYGAKFFIRRWFNGTAFPFNDSAQTNAVLMDVANGDAVDYADGDLTMGGTVVDAGFGNPTMPLAVIGPTNRISVGLIGDSRIQGWRDTVDTDQGDSGEAARQLGIPYAYLNLGVGGDTVLNFITGTNSALRRSLLQYCTHIIVELGEADIQGNAATALQVEANLQTLYAMTNIAGKPIFQDTFCPISTSTNSWATTGAQTTDPTNPIRNTVNTWIRGKPSPLTGIFDTTVPVETTTGSGIYNAPGYTVDGIHLTQTAYRLVKDFGVVKPLLLQ